MIRETKVVVALGVADEVDRWRHCGGSLVSGVLKGRPGRGLNVVTMEGMRED